jgi:hypothetical protein
VLTIDDLGRRVAAATILRAHSDEELAIILLSCTPSVADDCRQYIARHGRPAPFSVRAKATFMVERARLGAVDAF